jgi:hypothetical protein
MLLGNPESRGNVTLGLAMKRTPTAEYGAGVIS